MSPFKLNPITGNLDLVNLSSTPLTGAGNVTSSGSSTAGNIVFFADTTGALITDRNNTVAVLRATTVTATSLASLNISTTNLTGGTLTVTTLTSTNIGGLNCSVTNFQASSVLSTTVTATSLGSLNLSTTNLQAVSITTTNIACATLTATNTDIKGYTDFLAISTPASPSATNVRTYSLTTQGHSRPAYIDDDGVEIVLGRDNFIIAKNTTGVQINKGQAVYVNGDTGNVPNVALAKADSINTLPSIGLALTDIAINAFGYILEKGILSNFDTSSFTTGSNVWVSAATAGALTATRPVSPSLAQRMGTILVSNVGNGSIDVVTAPFVGGLESGTTQNFTLNGNTLTAGVVTATSLASLNISTTNLSATLVTVTNATGVTATFNTVTATSLNSMTVTNIAFHGATFVMDGAGSQLATGTAKGFLVIPYNATITNIYVIGDQTGAIGIDIWKSQYNATNLPTNGNSIFGSGSQTISFTNAQAIAVDSGYTGSVLSGDVLRFNIDTCSALTNVAVNISMKKV